MKLYHGSYDKLSDMTVRAGSMFNGVFFSDDQGWNEVFSWHPVQEPGLYDEVEVELPEGAKMVNNGFNQDAVELANGCICPDLLTMRRRGNTYPYIVDTTGDKPKNIFLKEVNQ